jgi:hypothetical protein
MRASNFAGTPALGAAEQSSFTLPATLPQNKWALGGTWQVGPEKITSKDQSTFRFNIAAKEVYIVAGSDTPQKMTVLLNGQPIQQTSFAGADVTESTVTIGESKLYRLVRLPQFSTNQQLELQVPDGVSLNVFTFGS